MSHKDFVKGECPLCGGHFEFPSEATGQTIPCPHCGQIIDLGANRAPRRSRRQKLAVGIALSASLAAMAAALLARLPHPPSSLPPPVFPKAVVNEVKPAATNPAPVAASVETLRADEIGTNSFGISGGKLQKTPGTSLVYVLGTVRNLGPQQRFGVKIDYALFDTAGKVVGHATDYQSELDPHAEWDFKALVMQSKAATAEFYGITEQ